MPKFKKTPARLSVPLLPILTPDGKEAIGGRTAGSFDILTAEKDRKRLSAEFQGKFKTGEVNAIRNLLLINPSFINEPWVRGALKNRFMAEKILRGKGGRRKFDTAIDGVVLVALVEHECQSKGISKEKAFRELAERLLLGYERIKELYYDTLKNKRLAPLLFTDKRGEELVSEEQFEKETSRAELLIEPREFVDSQGNKFRLEPKFRGKDFTRR